MTNRIAVDARKVFADNLRAIRTARGITQAKLGAMADLPATSIAHYEAARRGPTAEYYRYEICSPFTGEAVSFSFGQRKGARLGTHLRSARQVTPVILHATVALAYVQVRENFSAVICHAHLSDFGLIHRLAHWMAGCPFNCDSIERLADDLDDLHRQAEEAAGQTLDVS